ncbi:MAG: tyrosine-type recombinase/integrase [Phycisphaerales bacterium]
MFPRNGSRIPKYRLHKATGYGVVRLNGRDIYLGKHGTPESHTEYKRVIAEWLAASKAPAVVAAAGEAVRFTCCSIAELLLAYLKHAEGYYVRGGKPTGETENMKDAVRPLAALYSTADVSAFGPLALEAVRQSMIDAGLSRGVVNARVHRIRRVFKWGVAKQLVPPSVLQGLLAVESLKRGRTTARETEAVKPVLDEIVQATIPAMPPTLAAMVETQRLTGMRPGEVVIMRRCDIQIEAAGWQYRPSSHKTEHHGRERLVSIGPKAQEVIRPFLQLDRGAYLFSPQAVMEERRQMWRRKRITPLTPSQRARKRKTKPAKAPGEYYTTKNYAQAIAAACDAAFPHPVLSKLCRSRMTTEQRAELQQWQRAHRWSPNQLRHTTATAIRKQFGIEAARVVLGHSSAGTTEIYAEQDRSKATEIMGRVG